MPNPVFDRLETQWAQQSRTPAGCPSMSGYQSGAYPNTGSAQWTPGTAQGTQQTADTIPYDTSYGEPNAQAPQYPSGPLEEAYRAPAVDAVDRGVMTYDDVVVKMAIFMRALFANAFVSWNVSAVDASLDVMLGFVGLIDDFILAMMNISLKKIRPILVLTYAGFEDPVLGAVSQVFEFIYPGIVAQAPIATAAVFGVTLALFASGKVRNSSKLMRSTLIALASTLVYRLLSMVLTLTGVLSSGGPDSITIMGIPLGTAAGLIAVLVDVSYLIQDFDQVKIGVERGIPAKYAWTCAFGILATVVWMYLEILRLIARFYNN